MRKKKDIEIVKKLIPNLPEQKILREGENGFIQSHDKIIGLSLNKISLNNLHLISQFIELETLYLKNCNLVLFPEWIEQLPVKNLTLSFCQLTNIPQNICNMENIQSLNLSNNNIKVIPESIRCLSHLTKLNLSQNRIYTIPEQITKLECLIELDISNNEIAELPSFLDDLKNLGMLFCSNNKINSILISGKSKSLAYLDLSYNLLQNLPLNLFDCKNLHSLLIRNNKITDISIKLKNLKKLKKFNISSNILSSIPDGIKYLKNLEDLVLSSNRITEISNWLNQLTNLRYLDVEENKLTKIPEEFFDLNQLNSVNLSNNPLISLSSKFSQLNSIEQLDLKGLKLIEFPEWLQNLKKIKVLVLSNNKIQVIPPWISDLQLKGLFLDNNDISDVSLIFSCHELEHFNVSGNPLNSLYGIPPQFLFSTIEQIMGEPLHLPPYAMTLLRNLHSLTADLYDILYMVLSGEMIEVDAEIMEIVHQNPPASPLDEENFEEYLITLYNLVIRQNQNYLQLCTFYQHSIAELVQLYLKHEISRGSELITRIVFEITPDLHQELKNQLSPDDLLLQAIKSYNNIE